MTKINIMTAAAVMTAIPLLAASLKKNEDEIHEIAVSTLDHAREHGDYRGVLALLNALPKGTRSEALAAWFRNFSNNKLVLKRDKDSKSWGGEIKKDRTDEDFNIDGAMAVTFADFTSEVAPKALTMVKFLASIARVANDTSTLESGAPKVPNEVKDAAAAMLKTIRAVA